MKELFTNKYFILMLIVTIVLLTFTAIFTVDRQSMTFGEDLIGSVITPFQALLTSTIGSAENFFGYFSDINKLRLENAAQTDQINSLQNTIRQLEYDRIENEKLREMLSLKEQKLEYSMTAAEVIAKDAGDWYHSFIIDKGLDDGLSIRCPVITTAGLVGHIYEIGANWAKIVTIIDTLSSVGAMVTRTGDVAVVESDVELRMQGLCKMMHVGKSSSIMQGDIVETSGLGGIYPKRILIGKIKEIRPESTGVSQYAIIEPAANFERISTVFVLTEVPEE